MSQASPHGGNSPFDLNVASLFFACTTLATITGLTIYRKDLTNRISFRLQAAIAIADIGNHLAGLYYGSLPRESAVCVLAGFWRAFGRDLFCFYNIAVALNLQLVFLHGYTPKLRDKILYWVVPLAVSLILNIPFLDEFGKPKTGNGNCFIRYPASTNGKIITILNINTVLLLTFAYCTIIAVMVIIKLNASRNTLATAEITGGDIRKSKIRRQLKKLIIRVALYPLVCIIALSGYLVLQFFTAVNPKGITIEVANWSIWTSNFAGSLNFMAFILDPTLHNAVVSIYKDIRYGNVGNLDSDQTDKQKETTFDLDEADNGADLDFYNDSECKAIASNF